MTKVIYVQVKGKKKKKPEVIFSKRKTLSKLPIKTEVKKSISKTHKKAFLLQKNKKAGKKWADKLKSFQSSF